MTFEQFRKKAEESGLEAHDKGNGHWQIIGGDFLVNYYPFAKKGASIYVQGMKMGFKGTANRAIACATNLPGECGARDKRRGSKSRARKKRLFKKIQHCHWCGVPLVLDKVRATDEVKFATLEHIIPLGKGGLDNMNNMTLACAACNHARGSK